MMGAIKAITLDNVLLQENGILRDENGLLIARLVDSVKFDDIENSLKRKVINTKLKKENEKMLNERDSADLMNRLANQADEIHQARLRTEIETAEYNLFATLKPKFEINGDKYYISFGDNLQKEIVGFGDTLYLAILDFNRSFHKTI